MDTTERIETKRQIAQRGADFLFGPNAVDMSTESEKKLDAYIESLTLHMRNFAGRGLYSICDQLFVILNDVPDDEEDL